jgi:glycosyltransferase involved in cell wall biosynthesis
MARVTSLGLTDHVVLAGERADVASLVAAADLLLLTSLREGIPGVVLEARAAGTPVVATDLPGVREIERRLGGVTPVGLDQPDATWADHALAALAVAPTQLSRARARESFASSPFSSRASIAGHVSLYTRAAP